MRVPASYRTGFGPGSQVLDIGCVFGLESLRHRNERLLAAIGYDLLTGIVVER
jgi:hypothetical protein